MTFSQASSFKKTVYLSCTNIFPNFCTKQWMKESLRVFLANLKAGKLEVVIDFQNYSGHAPVMGICF